MAAYTKDKIYKIAAATVITALLLGLSGAFWVDNGAGLVLLIGLQAALLIGAGVFLSRTSKK